MRFLKFDIYNQGNVGFFNNLMSLELAVGLSILSNRQLLLNHPKYPVFNSEKGINLFGLADLHFPHELGDFSGFSGTMLPNLHVTRFEPGDLDPFEGARILTTRNDQTLGYYSYVLPFDERIVSACRHLIKIKEQYRRAALAIVEKLQTNHGRYASVHVRRTDFMLDHERTRNVGMDEIVQNIRCHVPPGCFLLIHSDERDAAYFQPILEHYPDHCLIDDALFRHFYPEELDSAEIGLVSALIASQSDIFLGTMFSTFTGYIQRQRLLNGKSGGFLYLYNQRPECLPFRAGRIIEAGTSGPTWERIKMSRELRSICFWWREWPESVSLEREPDDRPKCAPSSTHAVTAL